MLRYASIIPLVFFELDSKSRALKSGLRTWVKNNIPKDGDNIFKGKVQNEGSNGDIEDFDWLEEELVAWKRNQEHELLSSYEIEDILDNG